MGYYEWRPYVSVAQRRANANREMQKLRKQGVDIEPVEVEGRKIARTFWGEGWCNHLEQFSDYANRLPRGRTYVRNGSVCHLAISKGRIQAIVSGSELYHVNINVSPLPARKWKSVREHCAGQIGSMLELLQGRLSKSVMEIVSDRDEGLFPLPKEIKLSCDCPDWAVMCKHVAAVLYGVGARLDQKPELIFLLRNVDHEQLISAELDMHAATVGKGKRRRLASQDLSNVFGVDIEDAPRPSNRKKAAAKGASQTAGGKAAARKPIRTQTTTRQKTPAKATRKSATRTKSRRAGDSHKKAGDQSAVAPSKKGFTPTATAVARLRKRFEMNRAQFADLLGVSPSAIADWENKSGRLNLQQRTVKALTQAAELTRDQAWSRLQG